MRYLIGVTMIDKTTNSKEDYIATLGLFCSYPYILTEKRICDKLISGDEISTLIFDDLDSVKKEISKLSVAFRRDDVWHKEQKWIKSNYIRKFYPIKFDSSKLPFMVDKYIDKNVSISKYEKLGINVKTAILKNKS